MQIHLQDIQNQFCCKKRFFSNLFSTKHGNVGYLKPKLFPIFEQQSYWKLALSHEQYLTKPEIYTSIRFNPAVDQL